MLQPYTRVKVADNSGARIVMCIQGLGTRKKKALQTGDVIVGTVKLATPHAQVKKKEVVKGVIVRQKKPLKRADGTSIRFDDNAIVLINDDKTPRGSRIFGPVSRELRELGYSKIISMATEVL